MSGTFWKPSEEQRRTILLLEALGLLHDLGKLSDPFLESQQPSATTSYEHTLLADPRLIKTYTSCSAIVGDKASDYAREIQTSAVGMPSAFSERSDLTWILSQVIFKDWAGEEYSFAELAPLVSRSGLARATADWLAVFGKQMQPGLLIGALHGAAHIEKEGEPAENKQPYSHVFRATPFGFEEQIETTSVKELSSTLNALPLSSIDNITTTERVKWLGEMRPLLSGGLADNRRPHNEVSLWDWGYTVASMAKAASAWIYKNKWPSDVSSLTYRTLRINLDILERYTHSDKISDMLGVRRSLNEAFPRVQALLEESCAYGNCFYRDETGFYFLLPDILDENELAALRLELQAQFPLDLIPRVNLGERVTIGELDSLSPLHDPSAMRRLVAGPRTKALSEASAQSDNNLYLFEAEWGAGRPPNSETCTVCGVRPVGYPVRDGQDERVKKLAHWADQETAERRKICRICLERRGRRAAEWVETGQAGTIWTDEVADDNGRLALMIGNLGLDGWLDGSLLETLRVTKKAVKNASPARLYRIAETARSFWENVSNVVTPGVVGQRPFRLTLSEPETPIDLGAFHAYGLQTRGVEVSVVWDKPNQRFIVADNLSYFARRLDIHEEQVVDSLAGQPVRLSEPSAFLRPSEPITNCIFRRAEEIQGYMPAIPLLAEPSVWLMLIPADKAMTLARAVTREYELKMGRLRDRLPLSLAVVFCHRRTPVRAILEAGRAMLRMSGEYDSHSSIGWERWGLVGKDSSDSAECRLTFDNGIKWQIPTVAGDGSTRDDWYPRFYEGNSWERRAVKHVTDLTVRDPKTPPDKGPRVWVRPSRFDFEFLDSTGRRHEIYYDASGRRPRRTRPFYLEDLDRFDTLWDFMARLAISQRHQVVHTIEATREEWYGETWDTHSKQDSVFRQLVSDTLGGASWPKGHGWESIDQVWKDKLIDAGVSGELADLAELHMEILKER